jgi:DUF4097 and DUF4098 domain-containing protein YvlB
MRSAIILGGLLLLGGATVEAQQRIDERLQTSPTGRVEVQNTAGSVQISGWDRNEIHISGTLGRGAERLEVQPDGDRVTIRVVLPRNARNVGSTTLQIRVPNRKDVIVRTVSAGIETSGIAGAAELQSVSGDIRLTDAPAEATVRSTSGDLDVNVSQTRRIVAASVSGDVRLRGAAQQSVEAEAVSGDVMVQVQTPQVRAKAVSGDIEVRSTAERIVANSVSGNVRVFGDALRSTEVETVSGTVRIDGAPQRGGNLNVQSHSGRVELRLPADVAADFEVRSFSGSIRNAFGPQSERTSRYAPGSELRFSTGRGGARIVVRTFSGSVELARR